MVNNILIIGITGNGKSALANLLVNTDEFGESNLSTSKTTDSRKSKPFEWEKKEFCVIDNIGFGDNRDISEEDILLKVGEGIHSAKEGITQVLFVFGGRFGPEQIVAFKAFKKFISESGITKYTTLIRTNFPSFRDQDSCEEDRQSLLSEDNKDLRETINSCNDIIYIDNPPIPQIDEEEADSDDEEEINRIKEKKEESRKIVLNHLAENCCQSSYKLKKWDSIYARVFEYIEERNKVEQGNSPTKEEKLKRLKNKVVKDIKDGLSAELSTFRKLALVMEQNAQK
jgi:adenylate kinase family enzyme